jgi:hypothetical protein
MLGRLTTEEAEVTTVCSPAVLSVVWFWLHPCQGSDFGKLVLIQSLQFVELKPAFLH